MFNTPYTNSEEDLKSALLSPRAVGFETMVKRRRLTPDDSEEEDKLPPLMRGPVAEALGIPENVIWGSQAGAVFDTLAGDFMKPVVHLVEELLNNTTVKAVVYSGQLDLICATPGTVEWINSMNWYGKDCYKEASRDGIGVNGILEGFSRRYGNFSMYWVSIMLSTHP